MAAMENDLLVLQGKTEVEMELLRGLLEDAGLETFHVPSAASALLGRVSGIRRAIRESDRAAAGEALAAAGLRLEDFVAPRSAYNIDEPYGILASSGARPRTLAAWGLAILMLAAFGLVAYLFTR
jgi:hypothetical protein